MKFKVGDKVKAKKETPYSITTNGWVGEVIEVGEGYGNGMQVRGEKIIGSWVSSKYFDLVSVKSNMNKLTSKIRRIFNEDLQKQYKAGLIDECGELTNEGKEELNGILIEKYKAELTSLAEKIIKEESK